MSRVTDPLTLNEHRELARELHASEIRLRELCRVVVEVYGGESRVAFGFERAAQSMDRLRREMQIQVSLDWPEAAQHERLYL